MSRRDSYNPVAQEIPVDILNKAFKKDNVQEVFEEIRANTVFVPRNFTTTLNTTENLDGHTLNFVTGTATGYVLRLPNATSLFNGQNYIIANNSSSAISVTDFNGMPEFELLADSIGILYLRSNSTSSGIWEGFVVSGFATGIISYSITGSSPFTTSSSSDVLITGFSITPVAGQYSCWYSADITIGTNNRLADCVVYKVNSPEETTRRTVQGTSTNFRSAHQTLGIVSLNGSQAISVRANISGGNLTVGQRTFLLIRLGPEV
jgi:hypothetical protein